MAALPQPGKIAVNPREVGADPRPVAPGHGTDLQMFLDGLPDKRASALRHVGNATPDNVLDRPAGDRLTGKSNVAGGAYRARYRPQRRSLAGAVGAQQSG